MYNEKLAKEFLAFSDNLFGELLDAYGCKDWGCDWKEFLEIFLDTMSKNVEEWKNESVDEEEDE